MGQNEPEFQKWTRITWKGVQCNGLELSQENYIKWDGVGEVKWNGMEQNRMEQLD